MRIGNQWWAVLLLLGVFGQSNQALAAQSKPQADTASYTELGGYLHSDAETNAWYELLYRLRENFDEICGDTFCEGDYSNIQALRFVCSVETGSGVLGQCVWTFAASHEEVDAATGRVAVAPKVWRCRAPLARKTTAQALLGALAGERPLYAPLPGTTKSIYDGLIDCL
ncbi:hypothetical protein RDV84_14665 [Lysobacter yananisis]|uniref:Uncharacterized protein n=1 Tax=Lysobacter yananisis TaxID=1003114 RepID=A0ABY9P2P4_9GAMM|nr:hypothetical protein [Lysobacter yananisis]WMT01237.1 hypothetical protein RDV84_14665 [Lysobacter yananisis]